MEKEVLESIVERIETTGLLVELNNEGLWVEISGLVEKLISKGSLSLVFPHAKLYKGLNEEKTVTAQLYLFPNDQDTKGYRLEIHSEGGMYAFEGPMKDLRPETKVEKQYRLSPFNKISKATITIPEYI